jgi:RHS repeat-associated protein
MSRFRRTFMNSRRTSWLRVGISVVLGVMLPSAGAASTAPPPTGVQGQSATLLPDGRWLTIGGEGVVSPPGLGLATARAWHSATVLPDGTVLVVGGVGAAGVIEAPEIFDPASRTFQPTAIPGLTPRSHHTATLLTDGTVLIAGGRSAAGDLRGDAERIDPRDGTAQPGGTLATPRQGHRATLLPDGSILLWGGTDDQGHARDDGDLFDPHTGTFTRTTSQAAAPSPPPSLTGSLPADGATEVPVSGFIALRFSRPVRVDTVTPLTVFLTGPRGLEPASVIAAEGGALAFVTPRTLLEPDGQYAVSINGAMDAAGFLIPLTTVRFTTERRPRTAAPTGVENPAGASGHGRHGAHHVDADPDQPVELDPWEWRGERRNGKPYSPWQALPPYRAPDGVTALAGQVLRLNGQPLPDVTITIGYKSARTDATGRFLLSFLRPGYPVMTIEGATASRPGRTYAHFGVGVEIDEDITNVLPYTIWLPLIDTANATPIPVPTPGEVVATTPRIPGLEIRVPGGVVLRTHAGPLTSLSITPIPVDRPPFPLPAGTKFFFTPQAHGAQVQLPDGTPSPRGVRMILANIDRLPPGAPVSLWSYDTRRLWYSYGLGTVSPDGAQIIPDAGVEFHTLACAFPQGNEISAPTLGPVHGGARDGDPVDLATGLFVHEKVDLVVDDVIPIVVRRTYRQGDVTYRVFGVNVNTPYQMFLVGDATSYTYTDLVLADGAKIRFTRISPGTGYTDAVLEHTVTPTAFYKARLSWNPAIGTLGGWDLKFKDGTIYRFRQSAPGPVLENIEDRHGNKLTTTRFGSHGIRIGRLTSPNGRWVDFTYDAAGVGLITQARDNSGRTVSYTYDAFSRLATVTDAKGGVTTYTYDTSDRMLTITDPRGITYLSTTYDPAGGRAGRVTSQTQADGTTYQFAYTLDGAGTVIQTDVTDPRGTVRRVTFDSAGYPLTDTRALGQPEAQTTTYQRQAGTELVTAVTDALTRTTAYAYDGMGNVTSVTRLAGTPNAVTTSFTYEPAFNQVASVTDPLSHTTTLGYDGTGNLIAVTDPLGHATTLTYSAAGQPVTVTDALGHTSQFAYAQGDLVTVTDPLGHATTRFTDSVGRVVAVTNPLGQRTRYTYSPLNRVTSVTDALAGLTQLGYDANGNLVSVIDARGNATTYASNSMDRVTSRTDPLGYADTYAYDSNGNVVAFTDRKGQTSASTYDRLNRRTKITYADGSSTTLTYDAGNRITQVLDTRAAGPITRTYDGLDRLLSETTRPAPSLHPVTTTYTYDAAGRRIRRAGAVQTPIAYTYDAANRLTTITQGTSVVTLRSDAANRRIALRLPNGTRTGYGYDGASRITTLTYRAGAAVLGGLTYGYDSAGNRISTGGPWARTGQPPALANATYDAANRQATFGGQALTYDPNGSLTSDGVNTYTWDARNQLSRIAGQVTASFGYDGSGRRTRVAVNAPPVGYFVYDGLTPATIAYTSTRLPVKLLSGLGVDEYFKRTDSSGRRTFLADALGSTVALTNPTGAVVNAYTYEAFGGTSMTGTTSNQFDYTGREDDGTGLKYYRARYYHPRLQRFISEDPIGLNGGPNVYAFVDNSPLNWTDPLGLDITVSLYPCCAGFNHLGVGVNAPRDATVGFRPRTPGSLLGRGEVSPDRWHYRGRPLDSTVIPTTSGQDQAVRDVIARWAREPSWYVLGGRDCGTMVRDALKEAGISTLDVASPRAVFDDLKARVDRFEDFRR